MSFTSEKWVPALFSAWEAAGIKSFPPYSIIAGVSAKVIKSRDPLLNKD